MISASDNVELGALELPVPAGATNAPLLDPVLEAIADFLGFMFRHDLDAKLATLPGTSATAVAQSTHVFTFNPHEPRGHSVKRPLPSLYVWWDGESTPWNPARYMTGRERTIEALYVFDEPPARDPMENRRGLFAAVDGIFLRSAAASAHPEYAYNGRALGTALHRSTDVGQWGWVYEGGQGGSIKRIGIDDADAAVGKRRRKPTQPRSFPAYSAKFKLQELLQPAASTARTLSADFVVDMDHGQGGPDILERIAEYDAG